MIDGSRFEPARFSDEELMFMLDHLEKPPHAALHREIPRGVNPAAVESALGAFYKFAQLEAFESVPWQGYGPVRDSILRFLAWRERCERIKKLGGPAHPSMFVWDGDRSYKYGIGADSGEMVRTEILDDGTRKSFGLDLQLPAGQAIVGDARKEMPWVQGLDEQIAKEDDRVIDEKHGDNGSLRCSICGQSQTYKVSSRSSYTVARARMGKHLKAATKDVSRHRRLQQRMFQ